MPGRWDQQFGFPGPQAMQSRGAGEGSSVQRHPGTSPGPQARQTRQHKLHQSKQWQFLEALGFNTVKKKKLF